VILMAQKILLPVMRTLAGPARVLGPGETPPPTQFQAPLLSLPLAFGTSLQTVPADVPYLKFPAERISHWRRKLGGEGKRLVGVSWRGSAGYRGDRERSIPFAQFAPLLATPGIRFIGLQKELSADERLPPGADFLNPGEGFTETAELVAALDLVISVDTAWAHVAGAAGRPLWVLLQHVPFWYWMRERGDSPWYPSARLFRQRRRGDWTNVMQELAQALAQFRR
jgi:ADP-heptose:LPS heptosyltransferase